MSYLRLKFTAILEVFSAFAWPPCNGDIYISRRIVTFATLLFCRQNAAAELRGLHELFESSTTRLRVQPANLDHLSESWNLLETMKKDVPAIEAKARACLRGKLNVREPAGMERSSRAVSVLAA